MNEAVATHGPVEQLTMTIVVKLLGDYARSCLRGDPDVAMADAYAETSLAGQFAAIAANPKIAQVYAS